MLHQPHQRFFVASLLRMTFEASPIKGEGIAEVFPLPWRERMKVRGKMLTSSRCDIISTLMLLFGHLGITFGAAWLAHRAVIRLKSGPPGAKAEAGQSAGTVRNSTPSINWDYRFVLVGSLLPDLIDKPVGHIFFRETISNGRIYAHTLLFLLLLTTLGLALYRRRGTPTTSGLLLSFGVAGHLIEDRIWTATGTLLWPLLGWNFPVLDLTGWTQSIIEALFTNPGVYIPELIGLTLLTWGFLVLVRRRKVLSFAFRGRSA
ncbi:MAG: hypothetical protein HW414_763 [Dehalococcoidia bacterium]|nr:hypothetical protein [Dehalococcoidia bacterium]